MPAEILLESQNPDLARLNITIRQCTLHCGCSFGGFPGWFGSNYPQTRLLFVSQNPGYARRPFGKHEKIIWEYTFPELTYSDFQDLYFNEWAANNATGSWFRALMSKLNLKYSDVAFTNLVKCPFTENEFNANAIPKCFHFLKDQIEILKPRVVVTLGSVPTQHLIGKVDEFFKPVKVNRLDSRHTYTVIPGPHPSRASVASAAKLAQIIIDELSK